MNWEAIGAVGEIVGALAVVVTLLYLALQVRYTRTAWVRQNERSMLEGIALTSRMIVENPEMADIMWRAFDDYDGKLTQPEKTRFHMWMYLWIMQLDLAIRDRQTGGFADDEQFDISLEAVATVLRQEGVQGWWESSRWLFSEAAQQSIDQAVQSGKRTSYDVVRTGVPTTGSDAQQAGSSGPESSASPPHSGR